MAVTPRTLVKNPLILLATVLFMGSAVMMLSFFVFANRVSQAPVQYQAIEVPVAQASDCGVLDYSSTPSEYEFALLALCYADEKRPEMAILTANQGLRLYPRSETLYNIKGFHQIELKNFSGAIATLRKGLSKVGTPTNGNMENNLAWAGLWERGLMDAQTARNLYVRSLQRDSKSCEAVHTGLWVEYSSMIQSVGQDREFAVRRFERLRERYNGCEQRMERPNAGREVVAEVLGVGILDHQMARLATSSTTPDWARVHTSKVLILNARFHQNRIELNADSSICDEASPLEELRPQCRALIASPTESMPHIIR